MNVSRFIVRNIESYDSTSDESGDEFDFPAFNDHSLSLDEYDLASHNHVVEATLQTDSGSIHIQNSKNQYKLDISPIIIPTSHPKPPQYSPFTSCPPSPSSYGSSSASSFSESTSITPSDLSRTASYTPSDLCRTASYTPPTSSDISQSLPPFISPTFTSPSSNTLNTIDFDSKCGPYLLSSNGFDSGYHEWTVRVINTDLSLSHQQIGIVSDPVEITNTDDIIRDNPMFGARATYGNNEDTAYYASYNDDKSCRCYKSLPSSVGWCVGDEIKICLDLERGSITFYLNGQRVRKSLSVQRQKMYYPIVSNAPNNEYKLIHYSAM
eukprot:694758_1